MTLEVIPNPLGFSPQPNPCDDVHHDPYAAILTPLGFSPPPDSGEDVQLDLSGLVQNPLGFKPSPLQVRDASCGIVHRPALLTPQAPQGDIPTLSANAVRASFPPVPPTTQVTLPSSLLRPRSFLPGWVQRVAENGREGTGQKYDSDWSNELHLTHHALTEITDHDAGDGGSPVQVQQQGMGGLGATHSPGVVANARGIKGSPCSNAVADPNHKHLGFSPESCKVIDSLRSDANPGTSHDLLGFSPHLPQVQGSPGADVPDLNHKLLGFLGFSPNLPQAQGSPSAGDVYASSHLPIGNSPDASQVQALRAPEQYQIYSDDDNWDLAADTDDQSCWEKSWVDVYETPCNQYLPTDRDAVIGQWSLEAASGLDKAGPGILRKSLERSPVRARVPGAARVTWHVPLEVSCVWSAACQPVRHQKDFAQSPGSWLPTLRVRENDPVFLSGIAFDCLRRLLTMRTNQTKGNQVALISDGTMSFAASVWRPLSRTYLPRMSSAPLRPQSWPFLVGNLPGAASISGDDCDNVLARACLKARWGEASSPDIASSPDVNFAASSPDIDFASSPDINFRISRSAKPEQGQNVKSLRFNFFPRASQGASTVTAHVGETQKGQQGANRSVEYRQVRAGQMASSGGQTQSPRSQEHVVSKPIRFNPQHDPCEPAQVPLRGSPFRVGFGSAFSRVVKVLYLSQQACSQQEVKAGEAHVSPQVPLSQPEAQAGEAHVSLQNHLGQPKGQAGQVHTGQPAGMQPDAQACKVHPEAHVSPQVHLSQPEAQAGQAHTGQPAGMQPDAQACKVHPEAHVSPQVHLSQPEAQAGQAHTGQPAGLQPGAQACKVHPGQAGKAQGASTSLQGTSPGPQGAWPEFLGIQALCATKGSGARAPGASVVSVIRTQGLCVYNLGVSESLFAEAPQVSSANFGRMHSQGKVQVHCEKRRVSKAPTIRVRQKAKHDKPCNSLDLNSLRFGPVTPTEWLGELDGMSSPRQFHQEFGPKSPLTMYGHSVQDAVKNARAEQIPPAGQATKVPPGLSGSSQQGAQATKVHSGLSVCSQSGAQANEVHSGLSLCSQPSTKVGEVPLGMPVCSLSGPLLSEVRPEQHQGNVPSYEGRGNLTLILGYEGVGRAIVSSLGGDEPSLYNLGGSSVGTMYRMASIISREVARVQPLLMPAASHLGHSIPDVCAESVEPMDVDAWDMPQLPFLQPDWPGASDHEQSQINEGLPQDLVWFILLDKGNLSKFTSRDLSLKYLVSGNKLLNTLGRAPRRRDINSGSQESSCDPGVPPPSEETRCSLTHPAEHQGVRTTPEPWNQALSRGMHNSKGAAPKAAAAWGVCPHFQKGFCRYGDGCRYDHITHFTPNKPIITQDWSAALPFSGQRICPHFQKGFCKRGPTCGFMHIQPEQECSSREAIDDQRTLPLAPMRVKHSPLCAEGKQELQSWNLLRECFKFHMGHCSWHKCGFRHSELEPKRKAILMKWIAPHSGVLSEESKEQKVSTPERTSGLQGLNWQCEPREAVSLQDHMARESQDVPAASRKFTVPRPERHFQKGVKISKLGSTILKGVTGDSRRVRDSGAVERPQSSQPCVFAPPHTCKPVVPRVSGKVRTRSKTGATLRHLTRPTGVKRRTQVPNAPGTRMRAAGPLHRITHVPACSRGRSSALGGSSRLKRG